jgi:hypothetical protein
MARARGRTIPSLQPLQQMQLQLLAAGSWQPTGYWSCCSCCLQLAAAAATAATAAACYVLRENNLGPNSK